MLKLNEMTSEHPFYYVYAGMHQL